jgi:hypothetical protein
MALCAVAGFSNVAMAAGGGASCNNGAAKSAVAHSKNDPAAASAAVGALMVCAQESLSDSPQTTAEDLQTVADVADILTAQAAKEVGADLLALINSVVSSGLPVTSPKAVDAIFAAALAIAGDPNIVAYDPRLYAIIAGLEPESIKQALNAGEGTDNLQLAQRPSLAPPSIPSFQYRSSGE